MIWLVIIILICIYLIWLELKFRKSKLFVLGNKLPGPKSLPLVGNLFSFGRNSVDIQKKAIEFSQQFQSTFRIWLAHKLFVVLSNPEDVELLLGNIKYIDKSEEYNYLHPWLGTGLLTSTGEKWKRHRKLITPSFHFKILEEFLEVFNENGNILVEKLRSECLNKSFNMEPYITLCTLDIICEATLGVKINAQKESESEYVTALKKMVKIVYNRTFFPWLRYDFIFQFTMSGQIHNKALKVLHTHSRQIIESRKKSRKNMTSEFETDEFGNKKKLAFLDMLLKTSEEGNYISDEEIQEEVDTFMFEGHDTVSSGITFAIAALGIHLDIQEKVAKEQNEIFGNSLRDPTLKDLQEMKYLEQVIKETLRLCPSVPMYGRDLKEDLQISDGIIIPATTNVAVAPLFMHRLEKIFPNAKEFIPERFSAENCVNRHPYSYLPFSAGPRNCIGQKFAILEMKSILSKLIRNFNLQLLSELNEYTIYTEITLKPINGIIMEIKDKTENNLLK